MEQQPLKKIETSGHCVWITQPSDVQDSLLKRREQAFAITMAKLAETENIETTMQLAEAFGRGLFADLITERPPHWTITSWLEPVVEHIFNPMGTAATFVKITDDEAKSLIFRCPVIERSEKSCSACPFSYGFVRGLFRSAFPDGEVLMRTTMALGSPMCEFTFKTHANDEDRLERDKIKNLFLAAREVKK